MYSIDGLITTTSLAMCLAVFFYASSKAFARRRRAFRWASWFFLLAAIASSTLKSAGYRWYLATDYSDAFLIYGPLAVLLCSGAVGAVYFMKATNFRS